MHKQTKTNSILLFALLLLLPTCRQDAPSKELSPARKRLQTINRLSRFSALPQQVKHPVDNPATDAKVALGKLLFYDPILSGDKDVACATCHHPSTGYAENLDISIGVNGHGFGSRRAFRQPNQIPFTKRNSQTILNTAFNGITNTRLYQPEEAPMFWDLRAQSLEQQALEPIKSFEEMRGLHYEETTILPEVVQRLEAIAEYRRRFQEVFGGDAPITPENIGKAIAAFERSLLTNNSRFDQYMRGDRSAISISEQEGFEQFKKSGCGNCHNGPMFSDYKLHVLGVHHNDKLAIPDKGVDSTYAFRTPSLRNLRFTAPYMHNGSIPTLLRVLEFYEDISVGTRFNPDLEQNELDPLVKDIRLKVSEMRPIISFLNTLNDESFDRTEPDSVPSGLPVSGAIR